MREISTIELRIIVSELKHLEGARIDRVYSSEKGIVLQMHLPNIGRKLLELRPPRYLVLAETRHSDDAPSEFCLALRKHLEGARLQLIEQYDFERIVVMRFKQGQMLVVELFSKGNIVLCDGSKILAAMECKQFSTRTIRPGSTYQFPASRFSPGEEDSASFRELLHKSERESLVKALAIDFGLGGLYAEEVCLEASADKLKKPAQVDSAEADIIFNAIRRLLNEKPSPFTVNSGKTIDVIPFKLKLYEDKELEHVDSFGSSFARFLDSLAPIKVNRRIESLNAVIREQEAQVKNLQISIEENTAKAEAIYFNYGEVKGILEDISIARQKEGLHSAFAKAKSNSAVKEINEKEGTVTIEIK